MSLSEQDQKLIRSAIDGNLSEVRDLLLAGGNVNARRENDGMHLAALLAASQNGRVEVVRALLHHDKVDANLKDNDGLTAFDVARCHEKIAVIKALDDQSKTLKEVNENRELLAEAMTTTSMADPVELSFQLSSFQEVAVKMIKLSERSDGPNDENLKSFQKELSTLKGFHHPNILDLYGYNFKGSAGEQFWCMNMQPTAPSTASSRTTTGERYFLQLRDF
ncbi:hypothetical protein MHU86_13838 [Fragilaria crotonensis]|nr:hypothetical protein MHU86_13838 [Fragilaria crotonensis]